jgi:Carboxypeptidase regulatory-like domain
MLKSNGTSFRIGLCACLMFAASAVLFGQFRAAIQGTIKDATGAVIPNAQVKLTNNETQRMQDTVSGSEGFYRFSGLPPGNYKVEASAPGMKMQVVQNVAVPAEATQGVDVTLKDGIKKQKDAKKK